MKQSTVSCKGGLKQTSLNKFLGKRGSSASTPSSEDYDSDMDKKKGKSGLWSRVKTREQFTAKKVVVFDYDTDMRKLMKDEVFTEQVAPDPE